MSPSNEQRVQTFHLHDLVNGAGVFDHGDHGTARVLGFQMRGNADLGILKRQQTLNSLAQINSQNRDVHQCSFPHLSHNYSCGLVGRQFTP